MRPTDEQLEDLEREHGKVFLVPFGNDDGNAPTVENAEHVFVIRRPKRAAWERFEKDALDPKRQIIAVRNLAIDSIVWPDKDAREAVIEEYPGALTLCGGEAAALGRGDATDRAKKYSASTTAPGATR